MKRNYGLDLARIVLSICVITLHSLNHFEFQTFHFSAFFPVILISADGEKYSPEGLEEAILNCGHFINQVVFYNDHCKYTTALVTLNTKRVKDYINQNKVTEPQKLLETIKDSFFAFTKDSEYKSKFPRQWIPSVFRILPEAFSEQNHMVNSTMKIVRFKVIQTYSEELKSMYTHEGKTDCKENIEVLANLLK